MEPVSSYTKLHSTQDVGKHALQHNDKHNLTALLPDFLSLNVMRQVTRTASMGRFLRTLERLRSHIRRPTKGLHKDEWVKVLQNSLGERGWNATWDSILELCCGPDKIVSHAVCDPPTGGSPPLLKRLSVGPGMRSVWKDLITATFNSLLTSKVDLEIPFTPNPYTSMRQLLLTIGTRLRQIELVL